MKVAMDPCKMHELNTFSEIEWCSYGSSNGTEAPLLEEPKPSTSGKPNQAVKYGELSILGYNGVLPFGNRGRRRSKFILYKRATANGVKRSKHNIVQTPNNSQAVRNSGQHSISYTLSKDEAIIVEYTHDETKDMFQIGRSSESPIDFVVIDTVHGEKTGDNEVLKSTVSRFACRILADRDNPGDVRVYAAGFNTAKNIALGEKATKWQEGQEIDGLTTNGVLIMHPEGSFSGGDSKTGMWYEVSVGGRVFSLRSPRSSQERGVGMIEDNILKDGTLIDLCGATLLWRSAEGLAKSPTKRTLETMVHELNATRDCPIGIETLVIPRSKVVPFGAGEQQYPYVYTDCGHVQTYRDQGEDSESSKRRCPICYEEGPLTKLSLGLEPNIYVDAGPPTFGFNPCGHMTTEKTVKTWANFPIPHGTDSSEAYCPFCATPLVGYPGYFRLIFEEFAD